MKIKSILTVMVLIVSQFETSWGDQSRPVFLGKTVPFQEKALEKIQRQQGPAVSPISPISGVEFQKKIIKSLNQDFNSQEFLKTLGPGVTGGGDSCEQKIAYSFAYLASLVEKGSINLSQHGVTQDQLKNKIQTAQLRFGEDLQVGRPVEAINVPPANLIILDRKICKNNFEPLLYYTPLMLHEVLRLVGVEDGNDYRVSTSYISVIQNDLRKTLNTGRKFRVFTDGVSGPVALAWGLVDTDLDFEELDRMGSDKAWEFFDKHADKIENYLVDLKTMKILAVVRQADVASADNPAGPRIELESVMNNNHNHMYLKYDRNNGIGIIVHLAKWNGGAEMLFATGNNEWGQNQIVGLCDSQCEDEVIFPALLAAMTPKQRALYNKFPARDTSYELFSDRYGEPLWKVRVTAQTPKIDSVTFEGAMKLTFKDGKFTAIFGKLKLGE